MRDVWDVLNEDHGDASSPPLSFALRLEMIEGLSGEGEGPGVRFLCIAPEEIDHGKE